MSGKLDRAEWDFSEVPEEELQWRMVSEYARESPTLEKIRTELASRFTNRAAGEVAWQAYLEYVGGASGELCFDPVAVKVGHWLEARETQKRLQQQDETSFVSPETTSAPKENSSPLNSRAEASEEAADATGYWRIAPAQLDHLPLEFLWRPGWTINTLAIDWRRNTNAQILEELSHWLKAARPVGCPEPRPRRGKKPSDYQQALRWLGTMRALHYYSYAHPSFPEKLKQPSEKDAYRRKQSAIKHFRKLFPFLPADECPIKGGSRTRQKSKST